MYYTVEKPYQQEVALLSIQSSNICIRIPVHIIYGHCPIKGHTRHERWHRKHVSLAGAKKGKTYFGGKFIFRHAEHDTYTYLHIQEGEKWSSSTSYHQQNLHEQSATLSHWNAIVDGPGAARSTSAFTARALSSLYQRWEYRPWSGNHV